MKPGPRENATPGNGAPRAADGRAPAAAPRLFAVRGGLLETSEREYVCERKFSGPADRLPLVEAILGAACLPDGEYPEGTVNSIYFDTPSFASFREKANGDNIKTKLRLRWYGDGGGAGGGSGGGTVDAFLEVKGRIGSARDKERITVAVPRALLLETPLESPALAALLLSKLGEIALPSPLSWRPACHIAYRRKRYLDPLDGSRVSLDWDIRAERFNRALFPTAAPVRLGAVVCEYKNRLGEPPRWAGTVAAAGLSYGSFSKYGQVMGRLLQMEN